MGQEGKEGTFESLGFAWISGDVDREFGGEMSGETLGDFAGDIFGDFC